MKKDRWLVQKLKYPEFTVFDHSKIIWKLRDYITPTNKRTFAPSRIYRLWNYTQCISEFAVGPFKNGWMMHGSGTNLWPEGRTKVS